MTSGVKKIVDNILDLESAREREKRERYEVSSYSVSELSNLNDQQIVLDQDVDREDVVPKSE